ncbi:MAG: alpha/beta hydrolase [Candidatus Riflebacteria bacterium]|nr:alpha/beta hydrolase [Candidatus Riflebacteria bacterium]
MSVTKVKTSDLKIGNTRIEFIEMGEGKPLFFLHGNPGSKEDWEDLSMALAPKGFRGIIPDRIGHGKSDSILFTGDDPDQSINLYREMIKRTCGEKAYLVAYSYGCFLALRIAQMFPDDVSGLGLITPFIFPKDPSEKPSGLPKLAQIPVLGEILSILVPLLSKGKMKEHVEKVFYPAKPSAEVMQKALGKFTAFSGIIAALNDRNELAETHLAFRDKMKSVNKPVIVIGGKEDAICGSTAHVDRIVESIKGVEKHMLDGGGHGIIFSQYKEIAELMANHIPK